MIRDGLATNRRDSGLLVLHLTSYEVPVRIHQILPMPRAIRGTDPDPDPDPGPSPLGRRDRPTNVELWCGAIAAVLVECDPSIKSIIVNIDSESHDYILEDLDDQRVVVMENKIPQLKLRLEEHLKETQQPADASGSDQSGA